MAATYIVSDSHRFVVSALTFIMALLVAQTRVESGVHSALEVAYGGALGALVTLSVFQLFCEQRPLRARGGDLANERMRRTRTTSSGLPCARATGRSSRA